MQLNYAYPVARIRAIERGLLDQNRINRMLDCENPEEILKILSETSYGDYTSELNSIYNYEELLGREEARTVSLLCEIAPDPRFKELIILRYDLHNLKVFLKARGGTVDPEELFSPLGSIPLDQLKAIFAEENWRELPDSLQEPVEDLLPKTLENNDPQVIDIFIDRFQYQRLYQIARSLKSGFIAGLYRRKIDLLNIEIVVRAKAMGQNRAFVEQALIPCGLLNQAIFLEAFDESGPARIETLAAADYHEVVEEGLAYWDEKGTLVLYEKLADDYLMDYIKRAKFMNFSPAPLLGFLWAKENEIKTLRIILVGKINNLPVAVIKERLRDLYV